jgi:hypothetical protein
MRSTIWHTLSYPSRELRTLCNGVGMGIVIVTALSNVEMRTTESSVTMRTLDRELLPPVAHLGEVKQPAKPRTARGAFLHNDDAK